MLLCSNCHWGLHSGGWQGDFVKSDVIGYVLRGTIVAE